MSVKLTKEESMMIAFEIVAYAGEARSKYLLALKEAELKNFDSVENYIKEGNEILVEAHRKQTDMIQKEASGEQMEITLIMLHAQDHLMNAILLKDIIGSFVKLYKSI